MKNRSSKNKNKILIALVAFLSALMCVSIGFATWITTGGSLLSAKGEIETDTVRGEEDLDVVTIDTLQDYQYNQSYGFVDDGIFGSTLILYGECSFDSTNGKECIDSFRRNKTFDLEIELTTSLTGGFSVNNMVSTSISLSSNNFSTVSVAPMSGQSITGTLEVTCNDNNSDFDFTFEITLNWTGADLSLFPDVSSASFSVSLLPKEHSA